jgi:hypothetical protein
MIRDRSLRDEAIKPMPKTICFGHTSERAISTFIFIVETTIFLGRFWHLAQAVQEIARPQNHQLRASEVAAAQ